MNRYYFYFLTILICGCVSTENSNVEPKEAVVDARQLVLSSDSRSFPKRRSNETDIAVIDEIRAKLKSGKLNPEELRNLLRLEMRVGDDSGAFGTLQKLLILDRNDEVALANLALIEIRRNNLASAGEVLDRNTLIQSHNPDFDTLRGLLAFRKGDYAAAESYWKKVLLKAPGDLSAQLNLGILYLELLHFQTAKGFLDSARATHPQNVDVSILSGVVSSALGNIDEAEEALEASLELDANNPVALINLAIVLKSKGQLEDANQRINQAISEAKARQVDFSSALKLKDQIRYEMVRTRK